MEHKPILSKKVLRALALAKKFEYIKPEQHVVIKIAPLQKKWKRIWNT